MKTRPCPSKMSYAGYDYLDDIYGDLPHTKAFVREKLLRVSETFSEKCRDRIYLEATYRLVRKAKTAETMYSCLLVMIRPWLHRLSYLS